MATPAPTVRTCGPTGQKLGLLLRDDSIGEDAGTNAGKLVYCLGDVVFQIRPEQSERLSVCVLRSGENVGLHRRGSNRSLPVAPMSSRLWRYALARDKKPDEVILGECVSGRWHE